MQSSNIKQKDFFIDLNAFIFEDVWTMLMKGNVSSGKAVSQSVESPTHSPFRAVISIYHRLDSLRRIHSFADISGG